MDAQVVLLFTVAFTALFVGVFCYSIGYERGQRELGDRKR